MTVAGKWRVVFQSSTVDPWLHEPIDDCETFDSLGEALKAVCEKRSTDQAAIHIDGPNGESYDKEHIERRCSEILKA